MESIAARQSWYAARINASFAAARSMCVAEADRVARVKEAGATHVVAVVRRRSPFRKPEQLALHRKTIELRRAHQQVSVAIDDAEFVGFLHATLRAWGIGARRSHLRSVGDLEHHRSLECG